VKLNIFKREEVKQPEHESEKEKDMLVLKDSLSSEEKKEFRDQLIALMVPIICWKEFPSSRNSERSISIIKGRHIIEDLKLKNSAQSDENDIDENYIKDIWSVCFERAKSLVRAEICSKKAEHEQVKELTSEDVFERDYSLSWDKHSDSLEIPLVKNIDNLTSLFALAVSIAALNSNSKGSSELFIRVLSSILLPMILIVILKKLLPNRVFFGFLTIGALVLLALSFSPQQPKPSSQTVPQSSTPAKPSPSPKPGLTEPLKNSQSVHQKENR
jgi:hypothetical protein